MRRIVMMVIGGLVLGYDGSPGGEAEVSSGTLRDLPTYLERLLKADPESNPLLPIQVTGVEDRFVQFDVGMDFGAPKSLLDPIGLEQEFEEALGRKVDLLTPASLSPTCGIR